jgi:tetratricopeptide (TPR) repeat protein
MKMGKSTQPKKSSNQKNNEITPSFEELKFKIPNNPSEKIWKWIFWGLASVGLIAIIILSLGAGNSGDEEFHYKHAENVYKYYTTFGKDSTAAVVTPNYNLPYYGQSVDNFAYFVTHVFNIENIYLTRHIINSIFGWLAMLFVGLIAYRIAGWRAAVISFVIIFLSPRFLGHSFNNLKDLPLATGMIFGIYCIIRFLQEFPKIKIKTIILFIISIGFAISVRFAGILIIAYFGLFGLIYIFIRNRKQGMLSKNSKREFVKILILGLGISIGGYLLAMLLWTFLLKAPIDNLKDTMANMSNFAISIRQVFEGKMQWSDILPWYYTPKFILMTIPIAVIIGILFYPFIGGWRKENRFTTFIIYLTFIFPIFWIIYQKSNVYGGWRHAMFAYPPMVVAAGLGFNALIDLVKNKYGKIALTILPFFLLVPPLLHIIRNHPYEYVYFNELSGGMNKAYGNYEMDYYYHSTREASEWVLANAKKSGLETGKKIKVATWHTASVNYFFRKDTADFQVVFSRWYERGNNDWDYAIFTITGIMPEQIKNTHFPPPNTVHTIDVDGKPICIILKRTDKSDFEGSKLKKAKQTVAAMPYFKKALKVDPYNEAPLVNLIECYFQIGFLDSAKTLIDHSLAFIPSYEPTNYFNAHYYISKRDTNMALKSCKKIIKDNFKFKSAYYLACNIYLGQKDFNSAEKMLGKLIDVDYIDNQGVEMLIKIYMDQGLNKEGAYKKLYQKMAKSFEKRGKEKEAEKFWDMYYKL